MSSWAFTEALTLGIATAINPCPLAASIAGVAFIGRRLASPRQVFLAGLFYALGGAISYVTLAMLVAGGIHAAALAWPLQRYTTEALGPILILLGMLLLELLPLPGVSMGIAGRLQARAGAGAPGRPCRWGASWRWRFVRRRRPSFSAASFAWPPGTTRGCCCRWPTASVPRCRRWFVRACWHSAPG